MEETIEESADYRPGNDPEDLRLVLPESCSGLRLDQSLARMLPEFSRAQCRQWIDAGEVTVDGRVGAARQRMAGGEIVGVHRAVAPASLSDDPEDIPIDVIFEDNELIVVDKPAGLVVHPGAGNRSGTLLNALLAHSPGIEALPRAGIVHRLDKDTSGLMVVAKTLQAQTALVRQLQARTVKRVYWAVAAGSLAAAGTVDAPVGRHPVQRTRMAVTSNGKEARTHYRPLRGGRHWTLVECRLETGRTHQIRVHLAHIGHPLLGDPVYGTRRSPPEIAPILHEFHRQALHARSLALRHPASGTPMAWESALPDDFESLLAALDALT